MGLGHLRRTHNIAREIVTQAPRSEILVLADSPVAPFFVPFRGIRYEKLPTILKTGPSTWKAISGTSGMKRALKARGTCILGALHSFRPDAILVDHMPVGALGELRPMLDAAKRMKHPPKLVLGLRDILDEPTTIRRTWDEFDAFDYLKLYDQVLIYGCQEIFDAAESYGLTKTARQVAYTHYVVNDHCPLGDTSRPSKPYVLVMGGGGADAFPLANAFVKAWPEIKKPDLEACILPGPNMLPRDKSRLRTRARALGIRVPRGKVDAIPWIREATAVVTMAGYNSLCEVLRWGRPALIVPRRGPSAEQRMRARRFTERRIAAFLDWDDLTTESLARELIALLDAKGVPDLDNIPSLDGASRAARTILSVLEASEPPELPLRRGNGNGMASAAGHPAAEAKR
jgi:predicted glycosyltransferase